MEVETACAVPRCGRKDHRLEELQKIEKIPEIRVWMDLTPKQQENRKAKIPKLRSLRQEGKIAFFRADRLFVKDSSEAVPVLVQ